MVKKRGRKPGSKAEPLKYWGRSLLDSTSPEEWVKGTGMCDADADQLGQKSQLDDKTSKCTWTGGRHSQSAAGRRLPLVAVRCTPSFPISWSFRMTQELLDTRCPECRWFYSNRAAFSLSKPISASTAFSTSINAQIQLNHWLLCVGISYASHVRTIQCRTHGRAALPFWHSFPSISTFSLFVDLVLWLTFFTYSGQTLYNTVREQKPPISSDAQTKMSSLTTQNKKLITGL